MNMSTKQLIQYVDYTSLNDTDTAESITALCNKAYTTDGAVAAVCVYPQFVSLAKQVLQQVEHTKQIRVATVMNFPSGNDPSNRVLADIHDANQNGANEIDVVFPYQAYLNGEIQYVRQFIRDCRSACGDEVLLKVILETGAFVEHAHITKAAELAIIEGADFIKTSTGKIAVGATHEAVIAILAAIIKYTEAARIMPRTIGIKISGGIRDWSQVFEYVELIRNTMGKSWISPQTFRIGSSRLIEMLNM